MDIGSQAILSYLLVIAFASCEGITHAILWSRKGAHAFKWNEHKVFVVQRLLFGAAALFTASPWALYAGAFAYPFFHNGFYYTYRDKIDGTYPKRFWAHSTSSTAKLNFTVRFRLVMFVISLLGLFLVLKLQ